MNKDRKLTRQQAINAFCKECIYDELVKGNWRQQVTACTMQNCSLYEYRPISRPKKGYIPKNERTASENEG